MKKVILTAMVIGSLSLNVMAIDNATGSGSGIAYGTGSSANGTHDISIGVSSKAENYTNQNGSIAIGHKAHTELMAGGVEAAFGFGQTTYSGSEFSSARVPADPSKVIGAVAIGNNTYARTGSTMVGSHNYHGEIGDVTINTDKDETGTRSQALNVYATNIGANSFSNGALTTSTGAYNIISSSYTGGRFSTPSQNLGATITGAMNSIESKTAQGIGSGWFADRTGVGVANTINGLANRTANTNGTIVFGAGNEVTNSIAELTGIPKNTGNSAKEFAGKLRDGISKSNGGGATMVIGGGNKADYTLRTSMIGVNNTVTGTSGNESTDNFVVGVNNNASNVSNAIIVGNNHNVANATHTVIIGSSDNATSTVVNDAVAIGHNTEVSYVGGVALGAQSKATVNSGVAGYDVVTKTQSTNNSPVWTSTASAVSVGDVDNNVTRQITSVSAGTNDTDAVNVAQLKQLDSKIDTGMSDVLNRANNYTDTQVSKVGARAAALSGLHYVDYNPNDKWSFAAGYGHYKGQNAGALGVAYQPNENTMISVSSTIGKDAMIGAGVSMKFGKASKMNANKQVAMAKEIQELRAIVAAQNAKIDALVDHAMGRNEAITDVVFPDVPENHWAYMMVQDLAYKGIVVGYPDGNFSGDRTLTRYEFAVALDRAISAGYMNPELGRAIKEFKPELDSIYANMRFRVDRESGKDGSVNKVERVRVNKDNTRDNYGTIVK